MKKSILMLVLLFPAFVFGQVKFSDDFSVSTGTPYPVVDAKNKQYFPDGKGNSISIKTEEKTITIQRYDVTAAKEINRNVYTDLPADSRVEKILPIGGRLFYFYSTPTKVKTISLNVREISLNDGTLKAPKLLFETKGEVAGSMVGADPVTGFAAYGALFGGGKLFDLSTSFDQSKILVRYRRKPLSKDDDTNFDVLGFFVFSSNLDKINGAEIKMPYTEKKMNNLAYTVANDGTVFMLAFITEVKAFELFSLKDATVTKYKLDVDATLFFQELKMAENAEGNLVCTGYYANGIDVKVNWTGNLALSMNTNGILRFKMSKAGVTLEKYKYDFPIALINQYESANAKEKNAARESDGKAGINDLKMINLVENKDGSTLILGEQTYTRNELVGTSTKNVYYYSDMVFTKIDKSGKLLWMIKLPKTQIGFAGRGGNGVKFIQGAGAHYILFLDNKKNADITKDAVPVKRTDGDGGYLTAYKVDDATGTYTKHQILDIENINKIEAYQFSTSRIFDATDKIFLVEIYKKGKEDVMIKLQLKN
jgi:hypothetical protein